MESIGVYDHICQSVWAIDFMYMVKYILKSVKISAEHLFLPKLLYRTFAWNHEFPEDCGISCDHDDGQSNDWCSLVKRINCCCCYHGYVCGSIFSYLQLNKLIEVFNNSSILILLVSNFWKTNDWHNLAHFGTLPTSHHHYHNNLVNTIQRPVHTQVRKGADLTISSLWCNNSA